ncbi:MAG: hypothetical protein AB7P23_05720 [Amphiplicatus sp.]
MLRSRTVDEMTKEAAAARGRSKTDQLYDGLRALYREANPLPPRKRRRRSNRLFWPYFWAFFIALPAFVCGVKIGIDIAVDHPGFAERAER